MLALKDRHRARIRRRFIAVWRDISARKQAEAAALGLAAIVESSPEAATSS